MSKFEVLVTKVTDVKALEGSDFLSIIYFRGFGVISAKLEDGSHRYKPGDIIVYVPQDSIVPEYLLKQGFWKYDVVSEPVLKNPITIPEGDSASIPVLADLRLFDTSVPNNVCIVDNVVYKTLTTGKGMLDGKNGDRVKVRRLRGFLSEGVMFPVEQKKVFNSFLDGDGYVTNSDKNISIAVREGDDVAEFLDITKYIPEIPTNMSGDIAYIGTENIPSFDIENIKKYPNIFYPDETIIVSEKLHGTFFAIGYIPGLNHPDLWEGDYFCYSKGFGAKGMVFKNSETNKNNLYVQQFEKILPSLTDKGKGEVSFFLYGEIFGSGVQDLSYDLKKPSVRFFDIIVNNYSIDWDLFVEYLKEVKLEPVPVLFQGKYSDYNSQTKTGQSTLAKHVREGVVIKPVQTRFTPEIGRVILKDINESYLTRKNATEYQ